MTSITLSLVSIVLFSGSWRANAADGCGAALARPAYTSRDLTRLREQSGKFTTKEINTFRNGALIELRRIAEENDLTIVRLLDDLHATLSLIFEVTIGYGTRVDIGALKRRYVRIDDLVGRSKLRAPHYDQINSAMTLLVLMSFTAAKSELDQRTTTHLNPFAPMTAEYVADLFQAADDGLLDQKLLMLETAMLDLKRVREERRFERAFARELAAEPEPVVPNEDATFEDEVARSFEAEPVEVETEYVVEKNLGLVLRSNGTLSSEITYDALTPRGTLLKIELAPALLKQHDDGDQLPIRRLLRGALVGRSHAGIKILRGVGPGVIEVKAVLHGHKRILGCLEGRRVRLLRLIDIKADGATYSKRIPSDFRG